MVSHWQISNSDFALLIEGELSHVYKAVISQVVNLDLVLMMLVEELKNLVQWVPIYRSYPRGWEPHRYDSL